MPPSAYFRRQVWATFQTDLRRAAPAGHARRRPRDVGVRLPARRTARGRTSQQAIEENFKGRARRDAPPHPLRQRAGALRVVVGLPAVNHSEIVSFLWGVADLLRDTFKRGKYQDVILPLTVLRRLDCVLAPTKDKVLRRKEELPAASAPATG